MEHVGNRALVLLWTLPPMSRSRLRGGMRRHIPVADESNPHGQRDLDRVLLLHQPRGNKTSI